MVGSQVQEDIPCELRGPWPRVMHSTPRQAHKQLMSA